MLVSKFDRAGEGKPIVEIDQRSLRQSFAVWSARYPEVELGLGIQLGHASLRQTFGYATDRKEAAVRMIDHRRGTALNQRAADLLGGPIAGPAGEELGGLIPVLTAEEYDSLVKAIGDKLYVGLVNDCVRNDDRAACGPGVPQLHNHNCAVLKCGNCLIGPMHAPVWRDQLQRIDGAITKTTNPALRDDLIVKRQQIGRVIATFDEGDS